MGPEFLAIIGVGIALTGVQWRLYRTLNISLGARVDALGAQIHALSQRIDHLETRFETRMDHIEADLTSVKERLSRIEGWIAGRFGEEPLPTA